MIISYKLDRSILSKGLVEEIRIDLPPELEHLRPQINGKLAEIKALFPVQANVVLPMKLGEYVTIEFAGCTYQIRRMSNAAWDVGRYGSEHGRCTCHSIDDVKTVLTRFAGDEWIKRYEFKTADQ